MMEISFVPLTVIFSSLSLGKRAELLEQMKGHREQLKILRKQQVKDRDASRDRNATLLQVSVDTTSS